MGRGSGILSAACCVEVDLTIGERIVCWTRWTVWGVVGSGETRFVWVYRSTEKVRIG